MESFESVNQRIAYLVNKLDAGNRSAFARRVDLTPGAVADLIGGRLNKPSFEVLQKIARSLPTLNRDWLLFGSEPIFSSDAPISNQWDSPKDPVHWEGVEDPSPDYVGYIGKYPIASPKHNTVVPIIYGKDRNRLKWDYLRRDEGSDDPAYAKYYEPFASLSLPSTLLEDGQHIVFPVYGNFMHPTFADEDLLLFSLVDRSNWASIPASTVCAVEVATKHSLSLEICRPIINAAKKQLQCVYDNQRHRPLAVLPFDNVRAVWSFAWRLTAVANNVAEQIDFLESSLSRMNKVVERLLQDDSEPAYRKRLSALVVEWSPVNLSMDAEDFLKDKEVKALYERDYGPIESREKYEARIMSDVEELIKRHDSVSKSKQAHVPIRRLGDSNRS